jgi:hypothetical protein
MGKQWVAACAAAPWRTSYYRVNPDTEIMEYWCTENEKGREAHVRQVESVQKNRRLPRNELA